MSPEKYSSLPAKVEVTPLSGMTLKPSNPIVLVLSLACRAFFTPSTSNMEKRTKSLVSHQKSWGVLEILVKMLRRYCKNKNYTRTLIIRIKIVRNKRISDTNKKKSLNFKSTYGDDRNKNLRAKSFLPAAATFPGFKTHVMVISWREMGNNRQ